MADTCCPGGSGLVYIDASGNYNDPYLGTQHITNGMPSEIAFYNTCANLTNAALGVAGFAIFLGPPVPPVACTICCPVGSTWSSYVNGCLSNIMKDIVDPVPCINCVCPTEVPFTCPTCGTEGTTLSFAFDFNVRNCSACEVEDNVGPTCGITTFIPPQYVSPFLNFKLRNTNFI